jgi:hypothetical protein
MLAMRVARVIEEGGVPVKVYTDDIEASVRLQLVNLSRGCIANARQIDEVMAQQGDLVEVVHTLKQVLCVKG